MKTFSYNMELLLRKHIRNMHTNKNTTSKNVETHKNDSENEMDIDEGREFTDRNILYLDSF